MIARPSSLLGPALLLALGLLAGTVAVAAAGLDAAVAELQALLAEGRGDEVLPTGRRRLRELPADEGSARDRARLYGLMFEGARRARDLRGGNLLAADLVRADHRRHGAGSVERVPGLTEAARWYAWADRRRQERELLQAALGLLAAAHGPRDPRLAAPLLGIAASAVQSRDDEVAARSAVAQALDLAYADSLEGALARAAALAARGDVEAVFGAPADGTGWYRQAWQVLAASPAAGPEVARATFARPVPIHVDVPDAPFRSRRGNLEHFAAGSVAFIFTVSATGTIEQLRLRESTVPMESVPDPVKRAFRQARYRPRLLAGEPVATPDHGFELRFSRDATRAARPVQVGPVEQQR